jgi:iron-sulfur cluster repair protein YtfE (RIC family)
MLVKELASLVKSIRNLSESGDKQAHLGSVRRRLEMIERRLSEHDQTEEGAIYPLTTEAIIGNERSFRLTQAVRHELANLPPRFLLANKKGRSVGGPSLKE